MSVDQQTKCDVLVVGAGHAGLAAALAAAKQGARVTVVDDNPAPGGQISRAKLGKPERSIQDVANQLVNFGVEIRLGDTVVDLPAQGQAITAKSCIVYRSLILATGSRELFLPFPGCSLPGVMGAGGLQALVKSGLEIAKKQIVVAGSGPLLLPVAHFLAQCGAQVHGPYEQIGYKRLSRFALTVALKGQVGELIKYSRTFPKYKPKTWVAQARGTTKLHSVELSNGKVIDCDYLASSYGLVPNNELARLLGCELRGAFVQVDEFQRTSVANVFCVGEPTGIGGYEKGRAEGAIAGKVAAGSKADLRPLVKSVTSHQLFATGMERTFEIRAEVLALAQDDTIVCRCEDVTYGRLKQQPTLRDAKLQTRCGMGPCQGRVCGPAMQMCFGWPLDTVRPPIVPVALSRLGACASQQPDVTEI